MRVDRRAKGTLIRRLITFTVGFAVFFSGAAIANEISVSESEKEILAEDKVASLEEPAEAVPDNCVEGVVSSAEEVDCLIAEGVVPEETREDYLRMLGVLPPLEEPYPLVQPEPFPEECVQREVVSVEELDCLIAHGLVAPESREIFLSWQEELKKIPVEIPPDPFAGQRQCSEIGKSNELDNDCFCVSGELSDVTELDCMIASGFIAPEKRESYLYYFEHKPPPANTEIQCSEIGRSNELDNDCFCVAGQLSNMAEVDCLIASGVIPPQTREGYLLDFESSSAQ